ncbi:MAG: pyridoxamine 5'-phosphate oxidase family protein [Actinobacteria bacterium]|nr:pyridoxamine 5'-phosphate oxidase family protein [Actinomycetota bacterium]MBI3686350.1 pyridoxamine 5'-phosphate oxidase family protein [Actinomycetota bacterium]
MQSQAVGYHAGERAVQARAGLTEQAEHAGRAIRERLPAAAVAFLAEQPLLVVGAADSAGRMWASLLTGPPGFLHPTDDRTIDVQARPRPHDPLAEALAGTTRVGTIAIEPGTRRRMRVNGCSHATPQGLTITAHQVIANCPKYIQKRTPRPTGRPQPPMSAPAAHALTPRQQQMIRAADTFFVATRSADGDADASHRGGQPGFLRAVSSSALQWPDYPGNAMMLTLGNLHQDPAAGLLLIDWDTGTTLQLTGHAAVDWDPAAAASVPGAERVVRFTLTRVVEITHNTTLTWTPPEPSRFNPS